METIGQKRASRLKGKGGLVMAGVLVVLGTYIWWDSRHGKPREPDSDPRASDFIGVRQPEQATRVEVRGIPQPYVLVKQADQWRLESPIKAPASKQTIEDALRSLLDANVSMYLGDRVRGDKLKQYGLDKPAVEILLTNGGQRVVQVGSEWRSGDLFAREKADERVFVLSNHTVEGFKNKKPEDFRDKSMLPIADTEKVRRLEILGPKGRVVAERRGQDWMITQPAEAKADSMEVNSVLTQAKSTEAETFVAGGGNQPLTYGLDKPRITVTVTDEKGRHTLLIGGQTKDKDPKVYALRQGEPDVMVVPKTAFENFDKGPLDLRTREMLGFQTEKARRVAVKAPAGSYELEKRGEDWWLVKPVASRAESSKVTSLLYALSGSAVKFIEERPTDLSRFGLVNPVVEARIQVTGEPESRLFIGSPTPSKDKGYYAKTGKSPAVYEVSDFTYQDINQKPDDMKAK